MTPTDLKFIRGCKIILIVLGGLIATVLMYNWRVAQMQKAFTGLVLAPEPPRESQFERWRRFKAEAEAGQLASVSNAVVGWTRTVRSRIDDSEENPNKWTGEATVEFVNPIGGIERTNVLFLFRQDAFGSDNTPHIKCYADEDRMREIALRPIQQHLDEMQKRFSER